MKLQNGWNEVELGELLDFQVKTGRPASEGLNDGKYKFFTSGEKQKLYIEESDFEGPHLILATGGKAAIQYCDEKFSASNDCLVAKIKQQVLTKYVYYFLKTNIHLLAAGFRGAGLKHTSKERIQKIRIPCPEDKNTQKKIVLQLENIEKVKEWRQDSNKLTDKFLKSIFFSTFGNPGKNEKKHEVISLRKILIEPPQNGLYKQASEYTKNENGTPIVRIDSFYSGKIRNLTNLKRLKCSEKECALFGLENGNIIVNRVNSLEYLGKCALVEGLKETTVFESNMMRLRIDTKKVNPIFLVNLLCMDYLKSQILSKAKKAVNQASINQEDVQDLVIILPPISLQNQYAKLVKGVDYLKEQQNYSENNIGNLFNSLSQVAFRGELVC